MTQQQNLSVRAWGELLLLSAVWGGSFMAFRVALDEIGVATTVMHRVVWAALLLWVYVIIRGYSVPRTARVWGAFFVMGLLNNVIPFSLIAWGQLTVETGLTSIFNASTAVFGVPVAALFFADEKLIPRKVIGVGLGFFGVMVAIGLDSLRSFDARSLGQIAILAACLSYAFAGAFARAWLSGLKAPVAAAGMLTGSTVLAIPAAIYFDGPIRFDLLPSTYAAIAYVSVAATAIAYLLYYRVLAMAGSGNLMLTTLLIPPFAITLGALMRDEVLAIQSLIGFGILALGLIILDGRLLSVFARKANR